MTMYRFNITNLIKASIALVFASMLNMGLVNIVSAQELEPEKVIVTEVEAAGECSASVYRAQHSAGCWSCLVLEKITSAFLQVAKNGMKVTQKVGVMVLSLGSILWILMWGLNSVSTFSEVQLANILNDLFKFMFKALLAYWFIVLSSTAIGEYFVRPIMSVGAAIGQNMWDSEIKTQIKPWDNLSDEDLTEGFANLRVNNAERKQEKKEEKYQNDEGLQHGDQEILNELEARRQKDKDSKSVLPPLQLPGTNGTITSFPGCQIPEPIVSQSDCGSNSHMGLDISAQEGTPVWAIAGGDILFARNGSWGNMAKITTKHNGATWTHLYGHLNNNDWKAYREYFATRGYKVARGEIIGSVGNTGSSNVHHLHLELIVSGTIEGKTYNNEIIDPMALADGEIVPVGQKSGSPTGAVSKSSCACGQGNNPACSYHSKWSSIDKAKEVESKQGKSCQGFNTPASQTRFKVGSKVPTGGITNPGVKAEAVISADTSDFIVTGNNFYKAPTIPQIAYTGPSNIVPKSIMESLLGALRVITNTTAETLVLGKMVMCYADLENGGKIEFWKIKIINLIKWLQGAAIFVIGLMLTMSVAYYFLDISFKLGFAVLAMPIAVGLWPFKKTEDKVKAILSIMIKAAASFAFMALVTTFGMTLVSESLGDLDVLYEKIEAISETSSDEELDKLNAYIDDTLALFSTTFLLMCFTMYYFFNLVKNATSKFTDKFFKDSTFGGSKPMHEGATKATSKAFNGALKVTGLKYGADVIKHQAGKLASKPGQKLGESMGKAANSIVNKVRGKK